MSSLDSDTLMCRFKFIGLYGCKLDSGLNLTYVEGSSSKTVILPYGLHGLIGTGFSGLDIEVLKFNKELSEFNITALSNCNKLKEIHIYANQLDLLCNLNKSYKDLQIIIRKECI